MLPTSDILRDYSIAAGVAEQDALQAAAQSPDIWVTGDYLGSTYDGSYMNPTTRQITESLRAGVNPDDVAPVESSWWETVRSWLGEGSARAIGSNPITEVAMTVWGSGSGNPAVDGQTVIEGAEGAWTSTSDAVRSGADYAGSLARDVGSNLAVASKWAILGIAGLATLAVVVAARRV